MVRSCWYFTTLLPPAYFKYRPDFRKLVEFGYKQLLEFNKTFEKSVCDSNFNKKILQQYGFQKEIIVIPPFVNLTDKFGLAKKIKKTKVKKILFVSQIAPHKNQLKLAKIFTVYNKLFENNSELYLVGGFNQNDEYYQKIEAVGKCSKKIHITGKIALEELKKLYETADLFVSLSEHEGFSVPLVEAMYFSLPIIAYNAGAVSDTLQSGGILLNKDDPLSVAALIDTMIRNNTIKKNDCKKSKNCFKKI